MIMDSGNAQASTTGKSSRSFGIVKTSTKVYPLKRPLKRQVICAGDSHTKKKCSFFRDVKRENKIH